MVQQSDRQAHTYPSKPEDACAGGGNFSVPVGGAKSGGGSVAVEGEIARQIVEAEDSSAWTLMHRFNKAADLLDQALRVRTHASNAFCWALVASPSPILCD